jgi:tetratricopeptide (TPR) repeat protein
MPTFGKGNAHHLLSEYDQAIKDLNAALEQGHPPIKVYEVRWEAHYMMKNYDAALSDVEQALRIEPSNNYLFWLSATFVVSKAIIRKLSPLTTRLCRAAGTAATFITLSPAATLNSASMHNKIQPPPKRSKTALAIPANLIR